MNKKEFVRRAAKNQKNSILETRYWVDIVLEELKKAIVEEKNLDLYGFGKFEHVLMKGHNVRNPDGEITFCPSWTKVKFTPSRYIKAAVKDGLTAAEFGERMKAIRAFHRGENEDICRVVNGHPVMRDEVNVCEDLLDDEDDSPS